MPRRVTRRSRPTAGSYDVDLGTAELIPDDDVSDGWTLLLDGIPSSHVDLADPTRLEFEYVRWFGDALDCLRPAGAPLDTVHLGGGAATLARYVATTRPGSRQVVIEVDRRLVELVQSELGLASLPGVAIQVAEARAGLSTLAGGSADVVVRDVFVGTAVPPWLATVECAREVARVLRPGGTYLVNVADGPPLALVASEAATLGHAFDHVALVAEPAVLRGRRPGNVVLLASMVPLPLGPLARAVARGAVPARVRGPEAVRALAAGRRQLRDGDEPPPPPKPLPEWGARR